MIVLFAASPALAQSDNAPENVVITASRLGGIRSDLLGSSATVLAPIDLENRQVVVVSDALRDVPGIAVSETGPIGQFTQVRIRGAEANQTLVFIDGIKATDPFFGEFLFETLITDDVAKVEVLRGEQSALYGSDAIGGVVHYITATGAEAPGFRAHAEGGSFGSALATARYAGVVDGLDYALSGAYRRTDGVPDNPMGMRNLGAENLTFAGKFSYAITEAFRLHAVARYSELDVDANEQDFNFPPGPTYGFEVDSNGRYTNRTFYGLLGAEFDAFDGRFKNTIDIQGLAAERSGYGLGGSPANARTSGDRGDRLRASYVGALDFGSMDFVQKFTAAIDWEREYYQNTDPTGFADTSQRYSDNYGFVGDYDLVIFDKLALGAAARYDKNYRFQDAFTYRLQASYRFDFGLRPHAAAGSGIKNPGIYELYGYTPGPGSFIGNPNLKPERSEGWEVGLEQTLFDGMLKANLTYFDSTLKNEIFTIYVPPTFAASPQNATTNSTREGVEASLSARLAEGWRLDLAYTYLHALQNGQQEVRRAPNIASLNLAWRGVEDRYGANLTVRYNGEQTDTNFTLAGPPRVKLPSFTLLNFGADYRLNGTFQLYGRVDNLLDRKPEEVYTFRGVGRAFYAGIRAGF
ncbi:MAG TPA: TonB-dependent receptor [Micropepsaceae bacterium]|nr:TonB-dependent receptor [Micropepsaceae bacterium]